MPILFGNIASAIAKALSSVLDTFNRANNASSLGVADGTTSPTGAWTTVRGSWGISSNAANSATAATSYPLATLKFQSNTATLGIDNIGPGAGVAFWVTDANNWWATYVDGTQSCSTCYNTSNPNYTTCYNGSNPINGTCYNTSNPNYTTCYNTSNPINGTCYNPPNYSTNTCINIGYCYNGNAYTCVTGYNTSNPYTCADGGYNASNPYTCVTGYNTSNPYSCVAGYNTSNPYSCSCVTNNSVKLISSIASTISTVATFTMAATVLGIKTLINGVTGGITVRGYSTTGYGTQIGTDQSTTATGFTATKTHGIILGPTTYTTAQTANIDNFQLN